MVVLIRYLSLALVLTFVSVQVSALDICAYDTLEVSALSGIVFYEPSQVGTEPVVNATVELRKDIYPRRLVAKTTTDKDGRFNFGKIRGGKYVIYVEAPQRISHIYFPVQFNRPRKLTGSEPEIRVTLGFGYKGCAGSFAQYGDRKNFSQD